MKCPYCATTVHMNWSETTLENKHPEESYLRDGYAIQYGFCPECCNLVIQLQHGMSLGWNENGYWVDQIDEEQLIYPRYATARKLHEFIPHQYAELFRESEEVNNISPRASATLSRYLLQMLLHECESIVKRRKKMTNDAVRMRMTLWKKNSSNYTAPFANAMIADL